jgi:hypothetical protein
VHAACAGWGSTWYEYGFDERFLKHVIYPHVVAQGQLLTVATPAELARFPLDVQHVQRAHPANTLCLLGLRYAVLRALRLPCSGCC